MKCPECELEGKRSTVTPEYQRTTLLGSSPGYFDEDGKWMNNPDPNWKTTGYRCSNDHVFDVVRKHGEADRVRLADFGAGAGPCYFPAQPTSAAELHRLREKSGPSSGAFTP